MKRQETIHHIMIFGIKSDYLTLTHGLQIITVRVTMTRSVCTRLEYDPKPSVDGVFNIAIVVATLPDT